MDLFILSFSDDISKPKVVQGLRDLTGDHLPDEKPWEVMEGLIELGATICKRKPSCEACPLKQDCREHAEGDPERYPYNSQKVVMTPLERSVAVVEADGHLLVRKGEAGKVMADLYEFPFIPLTDPSQRAFERLLGLSLHPQRIFPQVRHTFTRYRVRLYPEVFATSRAEVQGYEWVGEDELGALPFSSGHRRLVNLYTSSS